MTQTKFSDDWEQINWGKLQKTLFRLQRRIFKAVREGDKAKARRLQKLLISSYAARMLAIRRVTQLNTGKKTAGIDGKTALTFKERFQLEAILKLHARSWKHQVSSEEVLNIDTCFFKESTSKASETRVNSWLMGWFRYWAIAD